MITTITRTPLGRSANWTLRITGDDGRLLHERCSTLRLSRIHDTYGNTLFLVSAPDGLPLADIDEYVNGRMLNDNCSENTRRKTAEVLCSFACFLEITGRLVLPTLSDETARPPRIIPELIDGPAINQLRVFFRGDGVHRTSNQSVNNKLGAVREFFKHSGYSCPPLFRRYSGYIAEGDNSSRDCFAERPFETNYRTPRKFTKAPPYISVTQYEALIAVIKRHKDTQAFILTHLMFNYGMRLGECLGLTLEDYCYETYEGQTVPTLLLSNRLTDKHFQKAKGKYSPVTPDDYKSIDYRKMRREDPYARYVLAENGNFKDVFEDYIIETQQLSSSKRGRDEAKADIVDPANAIYFATGDLLKENRYIFLNSCGRPLSADNWGKRLRAYFLEAGIPVDEGKRICGLSHLFRHGFAMNSVKNGASPFKVKEMMHHRNLKSTEPYFAKTPEDEYRLRTSLESEIVDRSLDVIDFFENLNPNNTNTDEAS